MTTIQEFNEGIANSGVSGVTKAYIYSPPSITTADMPASFVGMPSSGLTAQLSTCRAGEKERGAIFEVAIGPIAQDTPSANYAAMVVMADAVETALDAVSAAKLTTFGLTYTIDGVTDIEIAGFLHWGVRAIVSGRD